MVKAKAGSEKPRLFLIDSSSLIFRAFFAIRGLSNSKGLPTNAIYGFVTMLLGVIEKQRPDYIVCVFDTAIPTFRKEIYPEYKANRGAPPEDLIPQFEPIRRAVDALGIKRIEEPGFEADDVIGTLSKRFKNCEIFIVSSDKDLMQLVDERVRVVDTMKNIVYGPEEVKTKLGVMPDHVIDYLGLIGDTSDNIPGIPGVGPKTAVELITEYGDLESVLKATIKMKPGRKRDLLVEHADKARLSRQLATVKCDVPGRSTDIELDDIKMPDATPKEFVDFLQEMDFKTLYKKYSGGELSASAPSSLSVEENTASAVSVQNSNMPEIVLVSDRKAWEKCIKALEKEPIIAFDTETRGKRTTEVEMVGMSLCGDTSTSYYIPVRHQGEGTSDQIPVKEVMDELCRLAQKKTIVAQNLKYDYKVVLGEGYDFKEEFGAGHFFDTMIAHYLVEPEEKHGLDALSQRYLNTAIGDFQEVLGDRPDFSLVPLKDAARYGGLDAWATRAIYNPLVSDLKRLNLEKLFYDIEMPVVRALARMERNGVAIDPNILGVLSEEYSVELKHIEKEIFGSVGHPFNLNSPKQLSEILFGQLGLPTIQKTKTGFSTDVKVLEKLAHMHPVPALIVRYRELTKLKNNYVDVLPTLIEKDGRVHANFNQAIAATGRLSSSDPNLQNIPIKTESGRKIRRAFIAAPGNCLVGADYSQIELRLVAHLSGDEALIHAFKSKQDVHRATAAEIFHVKPEDVTDRQRGAAKAINFGLIYGKTAFGLAQELNISRHEAQAYIDAYFKRYRGVKEFMEKCLDDARSSQVTYTLFGRRRPIKDIHSKNAAVRNNAERMAMNTPVQGTAADIMKIAMVKADAVCSKFGARVVLQVHDELVLDVPESKSDQVLECLRESMESAADISVPLDVSAACAGNWMDL
jgi:DNA polymerase-1